VSAMRTAAQAGEPQRQEVTRRPLPGLPLGSEGLRQRAVGRIGGVFPLGTGGEDLAAALGANATLLGADNRIAVDWDSCWRDGTALAVPQDWEPLLRAEALDQVNGAFAAAWVTGTGALCLARDPIGERTLYYAAQGGRIAFASTIHGVLASGIVPRRLNLRAVAAYLSYAYLPGRETLAEGVFEVLPGEIVEWRDGVLARRRFWSLPDEPLQFAGEEALRLRLRAELEDAVRRRLPHGEEAGAFLSGGLDSSLVVALACRLHERPVRTYSISFGPEYRNELAFSSLVAAACGTRHAIVELAPATVVHHLDDSIALLSDPIGDPLTVPNALLFREAAAEVGVVLNGEGGDPCFGGPKNIPMLLSELFADVAAGDDPACEGEVFARERSYLRAHLKCFDDLPAMLTCQVKDALAQRPLEGELKTHFEQERWRNLVSKLMALNVAYKGGHHILPKVDALSAPFGVVARSPLFDRAIVETAFAIPPQLKLRGSVEKYLLKQAVADLLPAVILERPKSGMLVPVEGWFKGPLLPLARERLLDGLARYDIVERGYLERLLANRLGGLRPRRGAKIWLLVTLEAWIRRVLRPQ